MKQDEIRAKLIEGTIHVIAQEGLDRASTKSISLLTSLNEAYIYRCFEDKEDMFSKAFDTLDDELVYQAEKHLPIMQMKDLDYETRCRAYFTAIWNFLLGNKEKCLTFVRYYYSTYFVKYSLLKHKERYKPVIAKFKSAFNDDADVWMILSHILNIMLDFAVKVHNGEMTKEDNYEEHIFRVIYASIKQYFRYHKEN